MSGAGGSYGFFSPRSGEIKSKIWFSQGIGTLYTAIHISKRKIFNVVVGWTELIRFGA